MSEPWAIYALIFAATFLAVQFVFQYSGDARKSRRVGQRFAGVDSPGSVDRQIDVVNRRDFARQFSAVRLGGLGSLLLQSGLQLTPARLGGVFAAILVILFFLSFPLSSLLVRVGVSVVGSLIILYGVLRWKRARRITAFSEQLPDVIDIIVRSLKAGHPLSVSLSLVAREMPAPAGPEFAVTFDEITYGRELREALENLYHRVGYDDLKFLVTSIAIAHQTGGNLGEILARLSKMLRERFKMKRKVRSLSAEGRFSALVLSLLPIIMFVVINIINPPYYVEVWDEPLVEIAAIVCGILLAVGNFIMYRMVNFKF